MSVYITGTTVDEIIDDILESAWGFPADDRETIRLCLVALVARAEVDARLRVHPPLHLNCPSCNYEIRGSNP